MNPTILGRTLLQRRRDKTESVIDEQMITTERSNYCMYGGMMVRADLLSPPASPRIVVHEAASS